MWSRHQIGAVQRLGGPGSAGAVRWGMLAGPWSGGTYVILYADDIALLGESEEDIQLQLNNLLEWCKKWRMKVNVSKSKIVHYRPSGQERTQFIFKLGSENLEVVSQYKYLGLVLNEFLDFSITAALLAGSAGRALGAIYSKYRHTNGLGYKSYTKMYHSGVTPILDYCSGVWGYSAFDKINTVQNRAIRLYLGVHRFAPNLAINGDMGWTSSRVRRKLDMLRLWNRLLSMDDTRLTKYLFDCDKRLCKLNWTVDIKKIFTELNMMSVFDNEEGIDLSAAFDLLKVQESTRWKSEVVNIPKLRTYCKFKEVYEVEPYVTSVMNRGHRSLLAQFRSGILPLRIETGRYQDLPVEFRICLMCEEEVCEDEIHFIFSCNCYENLRTKLFDQILPVYPNFLEFSVSEKLSKMMDRQFIKHTAGYIWNAYTKRRRAMYTITQR